MRNYSSAKSMARCARCFLTVRGVSPSLHPAYVLRLRGVDQQAYEQTWQALIDDLRTVVAAMPWGNKGRQDIGVRLQALDASMAHRRVRRRSPAHAARMLHQTGAGNDYQTQCDKTWQQSLLKLICHTLQTGALGQTIQPDQGGPDDCRYSCSLLTAGVHRPLASHRRAQPLRGRTAADGAAQSTGSACRLCLTRLQQMDEAEVQMQVLSPASEPTICRHGGRCRRGGSAPQRQLRCTRPAVSRTLRGLRLPTAAPYRCFFARDGAPRAGSARHARCGDDLFLLRPFHRRSGVRAALRGDEPA